MAKKKITKKELRQNKLFVEKLLLINGEDYDDWLNKKHEEYIQDNNDLLLEALESITDDKNKGGF